MDFTELTGVHKLQVNGIVFEVGAGANHVISGYQYAVLFDELQAHRLVFV